MPLVQCPECGHAVSTAAVACPACGYPIGGQPDPLQQIAAASHAPHQRRTKRKIGLARTIGRAAALAMFLLAGVVVFQSAARITTYGGITWGPPAMEDVIVALVLAGIGMVMAFFAQAPRT